MLERLQYILCISLFVLLGSLDGSQPQPEVRDVPSELSRQSVSLQTPLAARNYISAAILFSCDASIELPGHGSGQKAIMRHRSAVRPLAPESVAQGSALLPERYILYSRPVDYYIYSLGRILI